MKIAFFGSSEYSRIILKALYDAKKEIELVVTKPPKKKGRGRKLLPTPVEEFGESVGLDVFGYEGEDSIRSLTMRMKRRKINTIVLAGFGEILPAKVLDAVDYPLNIHPSLLPLYRGAAPIQRAIMNGEEKTGVTVFWMNEKMDAGDIILQRETEIYPFEVYTELERRLALLGAEVVLEVLQLIEAGEELPRTPQDEEKVTFAPKIKKEERPIDWNNPPVRIVNKIRALAYEPGAYATFRNERLKIYRAVALKGASTTPGKIVSLRGGYILVSANGGLVGIKEVHPEGRRKMDAQSFINGYRVKVGEIIRNG